MFNKKWTFTNEFSIEKALEIQGYRVKDGLIYSNLSSSERIGFLTEDLVDHRITIHYSLKDGTIEETHLEEAIKLRDFLLLNNIPIYEDPSRDKVKSYLDGKKEYAKSLLSMLKN